MLLTRCRLKFLLFYCFALCSLTSSALSSQYYESNTSLLVCLSLSFIRIQWLTDASLVLVAHTSLDILAMSFDLI